MLVELLLPFPLIGKKHSTFSLMKSHCTIEGGCAKSYIAYSCTCGRVDANNWIKE